MNGNIISSIQDSTAIVVINHPEIKNAITYEMLSELSDTITELDRNPDVKVVIVTGSGEDSFISGCDISEMKHMTSSEANTFSNLGQETMNKISKMRPFVIAAVNGYAYSAGLELAIACDMRIASTKAVFALPETSLGTIPGFGGTQRLPRLIGLGRAKELMATGLKIYAEEAERIGLVNKVVRPKELLSTCFEIADEIKMNSTEAIRLGKQAMNNGSEMNLDHALELETKLFAYTFSLDDREEGMEAFFENRKPRFT